MIKPGTYVTTKLKSTRIGIVIPNFTQYPKDTAVTWDVVPYLWTKDKRFSCVEVFAEEESLVIIGGPDIE